MSGIFRAKIRVGFGIIAMAAALTPAAAANAANPPLSFTGAFRESDCTQCHGGSPNPTGSSLVIVNVPAVYTPGATIPIQVQISDPSATSWGFELSARFANGSQAGTFTPSAAVSVRTGSSGGFAVQYAANAVAATQNAASITFTATWTAPPDSTGGAIVFDAAGVAASAPSSSAAGHTVTAEARSAPGAPQINSGGVVSAASFQESLAAGELVSIFGQNLTLGSIAIASGNPLPSVLGGTIVRLNGQPCPVLYASPTQVNAQLPFGYSGALGVTVDVDNLQSPPEPVTVAAVAPAIFASNGSGAILHADYSPVSSAHPAKAGETVLVFLTGLGQTNPPLIEGQAVNAGLVVAPVSVTIGGVAADVSYAGVAPGFVGLYQVNTTVPTNLSTNSQDSGNLAIYVTAGAVTSPSGVTITIQ